MCVVAGESALGDWLKPWFDPSGCDEVLSQAPHALGIVLKRGRSQRPGIGKDQLYPGCQFRRQCWMVKGCISSSLSIVDWGVGRRRF